MKYAEQFCDWLLDEGYTHCFFVAGGNIMHLLDAARTRFTCIPFVHEVAAGIATEYFNELADEDQGRAFALVTAGPGLTNILTAMAGAWLESRELLVIGGQVKSADLASGAIRQRGIQELDGVSMASPICVATMQITSPRARSEVVEVISRGARPRRGPVFIEFCLDAQGAPVPERSDELLIASAQTSISLPSQDEVASAANILLGSLRPVLLLGGGVSRNDSGAIVEAFAALGVPIATTWNGADRIAADHPLYFGRPNTWGMRWANALIQQADCIIAAGSRLGMQQTGFNWQGFGPLARTIQIDIDGAELSKGHPRIDLAIAADAASTLTLLAESIRESGVPDSARAAWGDWAEFGRNVRALLPEADPENTHAAEFIDPYDLMIGLSEQLSADDLVIPCSSGGALTVAMQAFNQRAGQRIATDKGLASMGYGLAGAIGANLIDPDRRVILIEGDGGFAQNLQELGTVSANQLPIKMFIFCNEGYASIRMTQRNYFDGAWIGCDTQTGLGLPHWQTLFAAFGIESINLDPSTPFDEATVRSLSSPSPVAFLVPLDPEQTYYPKISSRVTDDGAMESNPLHLMTPALHDQLASSALRFLQGNESIG